MGLDHRPTARGKDARTKRGAALAVPVGHLAVRAHVDRPRATPPQPPVGQVRRAGAPEGHHDVADLQVVLHAANAELSAFVEEGDAVSGG
jgi:hypothetical protein